MAHGIGEAPPWSYRKNVAEALANWSCFPHSPERGYPGTGAPPAATISATGMSTGRVMTSGGTFPSRSPNTTVYSTAEGGYACCSHWSDQVPSFGSR